MVFPSPSTGQARPARAAEPSRESPPTTGYVRNTPTDQARHAASTPKTEDKARRLTTELTGMHVTYRAALRQTPPNGAVRPAEATDLGRSMVN